MPCCCSVNCSERSEKGTRLFLLPQGPKNESRRKQWINNINRKDRLPDRAYVCEKHFTSDQFENNRADGKRPLRWNAVPTIFSHKTVPKQRKPPMIRCDRKRKSSECEIREATVVENFNELDETPQEEETNRQTSACSF
ncbi:THAP domain-containing protein 4-like [Anoplophora glabripennis]|uniref:THAP domain-containing protein 4-like n=1 Tax=Anoplophora glabripennis TaxID=217634 RepID=UPI000C78E0F7|nr:THAP domain-containing protein 4-like [Anoplophora glabripennis]